MIVETIVGNVEKISLDGRHIERVYLESDKLVKRIQRVETDHGHELGIRLKQPTDLSDGDILYMDDQKAIVVSVIEEDLLVIRPDDMKQMGEIAHQLGNRHLPVQFTGREMVVQYDYLVEDLLNKQGIPHVREKRKVRQAFRPIGHTHG